MAMDEKDLVTSGQAASETVAVSDEQVDRLKLQLAYLQADFENFRRNQEKERALCGAQSQSRLLLGLLPLVDNFERALHDLSTGQLTPSEQARFQGIELIYRELLAFLARHEVVEIAITGSFDPRLHEAVAQVEVPGKMSGTIVELLQKGYRFRDIVLRPAKVTVAR